MTCKNVDPIPYLYTSDECQHLICRKVDQMKHKP